ncbi:MAG: AAA family ATPase [Acidobacteriota bacterium]
MITSIEIETLRGIRHGKLDGLAPLTILTGHNASGKSTVLDALLMVASPTPGDAVGRAVSRHPNVLNGARWLFGPGALDVKIEARNDEGLRRVRVVSQASGTPPAQSGFREPISSIRIRDTDGVSSALQVGLDGRYRVTEETVRIASLAPFVRLVDPGLPIPLHRTYTVVSKEGRRDEVDRLLADLIPEFERLEILAEEDDTPGLYIAAAGRSVPVGLAGDGIQAAVQLALELAVAPGGLALVEEPEVYQHPKAFWQTARVILSAVRRDVQVVFTTHSQELIDFLLAEATEDDQEKIALFTLELQGGELLADRCAGADLAYARQIAEVDVR